MNAVPEWYRSLPEWSRSLILPAAAVGAALALSAAAALAFVLLYWLERPPAQTTPSVEVSITELVEANRANPAAVLLEYEGKTLEAVGYLQAVDTLGQVVRVRVAGTPWLSATLRVDFRVSRDTTRMLARCNVDSRVKVRFRLHPEVDQHLGGAVGVSIEPAD